MRTRVIRRFFWMAFVLLAGSLLAIDIFVAQTTSKQQVESLRVQLLRQAHLLAGELPAENSFGGWVTTAAQRAGVRVTIVDRNGSALADSTGNAETTASPGRPEIESALRGADASAVHRSAISNEEILYVAIPAPATSSPAAVLALTASIDPINAQRNALWYQLLSISSFSLLLAAALGYVFLRSFGRQVSGLRIYAERLLDPQMPDQQLPAGNDDLGELAQSLRRTAPRIRELVENLKIEGARREAVLSSMLEGVLAVDQNLRVTFCNHSFARTLGASTPLNPGMTLLDLVRDPGLLGIVATVLSNGERLESRLTLAGAGNRSFEVLAGPLAGSSMRGVLVILHDITALERLERVRKDFVANVSHELRTPLSSIRGYAETLLDGALEDQNHNRKFVEIIMAQAIRLTNIAADLLSLSELESSGTAKPPQTISMGAALESAIRTVESTARDRQVELVYSGAGDLKVFGQQLRLEQVFINLLDNAIKFNRPDGEVHIEVRAVNGMAQITIADTGIGIPSEDLPRVFERFYRVDKARSREMGGTGLGLSIVKHAIEQMGGTIEVDSRLGEGSTFTLAIPMVS